MRIPLLILSILAIAGSACTNPNQTILSGTLENGAGQSLSLEQLEVSRTTLVDSVKINGKGRFSVKVELEDGELFILKNEKGQLINLLLSPGEKAELQLRNEDFATNYGVSGSPGSEQIHQLVDQLNITRSTMDSIQAIAATIADPESEKMTELATAFSQAMIKQKQFSIRFLMENINELSSVYALYQKFDDENLILGRELELQYFKVVADSLEVHHPASSLTLSLRTDIQAREQVFNSNRKLDTLLEMADVNTGFLNLKIPDRDGTEIALSSLEGKVILLVFWSSSSQASISSLLALKSTYSKYHKRGFEVYAVALENSPTQWMKSMDFNEFPWINVSELNYPESESALKYNIQSVPTSFLINRQGEMMNRNIWGRQLETWLDNLL